jgi:hypothetical protein
MTLTISITGDLRLDQTAGVQTGGSPDMDDTALATNLDALPDPFETFLEGLTGLQTSNAATYGV